MSVVRLLTRLCLPFLALWLATACGQIGEEPENDTGTDEVCDNGVDDDDDGDVDCEDADCACSMATRTRPVSETTSG